MIIEYATKERTVNLLRRTLGHDRFSVSDTGDAVIVSEERLIDGRPVRLDWRMDPAEYEMCMGDALMRGADIAELPFDMALCDIHGEVS